MSTAIAERCRIAHDLWTALWSGVTFACLRAHGQEAIAELELASLRRHQRKHFLPGLEKLGLLGEPTDAVRCAKYHYFSNSLGGLPMEYVEESPRKVWIRYRPPFWIGDGVTRPSAGPAALGSAFGRAAFRGWHARNGAALGNPRLAFVQTQNLTDGDPWDAGYFLEADRDLEPDETYRRSPGEWGPPFDPAAAPTLPHAGWPAERKARALRSYAVDHTATRFTVLAEMLGIPAAAAVVEHGFRMVLAQRWLELPAALGVARVATPLDGARFAAAARALLDDPVQVEEVGGEVVLRSPTSRTWRDEPVPIAAIDAAIASAWSATLPLHGPGLRCRLVRALSAGDPCDEWHFDDRGTP